MSWSAPPPSLHPPQYYNGNLSPSMAVFLIITFAFVLSIGFVCVYLRRCAYPFLQSRRRSNATPNEQHPQQRWIGTDGVLHLGLQLPRVVTMPTPDRGLSLEAILALPAFLFSEVKVHHKGEEELECAVCLNKFQDNEVLRLLPGCNHVFHPQCVDRWLASRPTCPICRANIHASASHLHHHDYYSFIGFSLPSSDSDHDQSNQVPNQPSINNDQVNTITAAVAEDHTGTERPSCQEEAIFSNCCPGGTSLDQTNAVIHPPQSTTQFTNKTLVRSHSTGHPISLSTRQLDKRYPDKFTLRLPEEFIRDQLAIPLRKIRSEQEGSGGGGDGEKAAVVMSATSTPGRGYRKSDVGCGSEESSSGGSRKNKDRPWGFSWTPPPPFRSRVSSPMSDGREREREENLTARLKSLVRIRLPPSDRAVGNASRRDVGERSSDRLWPDGQV